MDYLGPAFFLKHDGLSYRFSGEHFSLYREESFGCILEERERKEPKWPDKSKAPDHPSQGGVLVLRRPPHHKVSFLEGGCKDLDNHVP